MKKQTKKKIIFFDGDGTLWYPRATKHTVKPHWIYKDKVIKNRHKHIMLLQDLMLTPTVKSTLKELKAKGIITIILSTHPHSKKEAYEILNDKVKYFNLGNLFTEVHATREYHESKGEYIAEILKRLHIPKAQALMVGDNYPWDYKPARSIGVDALLVESDYMKKDKRLKIVKNIAELVKFV